MLLRVQDSEGRGPFRPGFTKEWCEFNHELPSIIHEFPNLTSEMHRYHKRGLHLGVGVRGIEGLKKWFSDSELKKLNQFGFHIVEVRNFAVVCESQNQVVFAINIPLRELQTLVEAA